MSTRKLTFAVVIWVALIVVGMYQLLNYDNRPGSSQAPPTYWPVAAALSDQAEQTHLVLVAHPHCACSRSSLGELAVILAQLQKPVDVTVLFYAPAAMGADWVKTDLWNSAKKLPGVTVVADRDGEIAKLFHAQTSGEALLYQNGHLAFWGGITSSRAHSGKNKGRDAIVDLLNEQVPEVTQTAVFGCHLLDDERTTRGKA